MKERVAILGASDKPARYAHMAFRMLREHGHEVLPVSPNLSSIEGVRVFPKLQDLPGKVDTLTMYVGPDLSTKLADEIVALRPNRVIFNPGAENKSLEERLKKSGIAFEEACTLVLLRTGQF